MTVTTTRSTLLTGTHWRVDPGFSTAQFRVGTYWGLKTVHGRFTQIDGGIDSDGRLWLAIDAASLDTGNPRRDRHLRSADFLHCEQHPTIVFRSSEVSPGPGERLRVSGQLNAAGRQVHLDLEPTVDHRGERLTIDATTTIDQRTLGMTYRRLGIRVPTTVSIHALLAPESATR